MTTRYILFAFVAILCTACAGMTAAEVSGATAAGAGVLVALSEAILPYLPADKQAQVVQSMTQAQGVLNAVQIAMGSVAQAAQQAVQQSAEAKSSGVSTEAVAGISTAAGAVALGASRYFSMKKDEKTGRRQTPPAVNV